MDSFIGSDPESGLVHELLDTIPAGAVLLTSDGRVARYNKRAQALLQWIVPSDKSEKVEGELHGISAGDLLDSHLLKEAFADAEAVASAKQKNGRNHSTAPDKSTESRDIDAPSAPATFAVSGRQGRLLRARVRYIKSGDEPHYLLLLQRPDETGEHQRAREQFLRTLTEGMRGPLANVRAAIETITSYPSMDEAVEEQFKQIILEQSVTLSSHLDRTLAEYSRQLKDRRAKDVMVGSDLLVLLRTTIQQELGFVVQLQIPSEPVRLRVDSYSLSQGILHLLGLVENAARFTELDCTLRKEDGEALLSFTWEGGDSISEERMERWLGQEIALEESVVTTTLKEILDQHEAMANLEGLPDDRTALRFRLPAL